MPQFVELSHHLPHDIRLVCSVVTPVMSRLRFPPGSDDLLFHLLGDVRKTRFDQVPDSSLHMFNPLRDFGMRPVFLDSGTAGIMTWAPGASFRLFAMEPATARRELIFELPSHTRQVRICFYRVLGPTEALKLLFQLLFQLPNSVLLTLQRAAPVTVSTFATL